MENFKLKNFRVFNEQGGTIELKPLTVLTGCNSSGKSSITKSWMLLQDFANQIVEDIKKGRFFENIDDYTVDFTLGNHKLGTFESVINWESEHNLFSIGYSTALLSTNTYCEVEITFMPKPVLKENKCFVYSEQFSHKQHDAPLKTSQRNILSAGIYSIKVSTKKFGVFFEYNKNKLYHINKNLLEELYSTVKEFDIYKILRSNLNTDDYENLNPLLNLPSDYEENKHIVCAQKHFKNYCFIDNHIKANILKNKCGSYWESFYDKIRAGEGVKYKENRDIDWYATPSSTDYGCTNSPYINYYPMSFFKDIDEIQKESIPNWIKQNITSKISEISSNKDEHSTIEYGISYIFQKFLDSEFEKFSDFYSYYELAYIKSISLENIFGENEFSYPIETFCITLPQQDKWKSFSENEFFFHMFNLLSYFGNYTDFEIPYKYQQGSLGIQINKLLKDTLSLYVIEAISALNSLTCASFVEIVRSNTQRVYSFEHNATSFNKLLFDYIRTPNVITFNDVDNIHKYSTLTFQKGEFVNKWLKHLVDIDECEILVAPEGIGVYVNLYKKHNRKKIKLSLADLGYGVTPLVSMLLQIEMQISKHIYTFDYRECLKSCIAHMGLKGIVFIEEPESNLHPSLQSRLAEVFADAITNYPVSIVLETHSEYLVRKLQNLVCNKKLDSNNVVINYLYDQDTKKRPDKEPQVKVIHIKENGTLSAKFGPGFFDESIRLVMENKSKS